jgi:hypothetical protein
MFPEVGKLRKALSSVERSPIAREFDVSGDLEARLRGEVTPSYRRGRHEPVFAQEIQPVNSAQTSASKS